jgi:putative ABC transport system permease protein
VSRPPRLAKFLLTRALPRDVRDDVSGDLEEVYHRDRAAAGALRARARYWGKALSFTGHFLAERLIPASAFSVLDLKLGVRMLGRNPGLTVVSSMSMAVAIAITAGSFAMLYTFTSPTLPLDEGDRIVAIQQWNTEANASERQVLHDFLIWRAELRQVEEVGAYYGVSRNLVERGVRAEAVRVTEMSAAGFRVARVAPLMGRTLDDRDEHAGAAPVAVIGYDIWRDRFAADPSIVGRELQLGSRTHTVVGVMPEGFAFPVDDRIWVPLSVDSAPAPLTGPSLSVFARLAPGATFESAGAEIAALGARLASDHPDSHARLQPRVLPYTYPFFDLDDPSAVWFVHLAQSLISLILVIVCVNVAILVYARTATRQSELAVRAALGARRGRIVMQLFVEGLVLSGLSALAGLALAAVGLRQINMATEAVFPQLPFWWHFNLSPGTVAYVVGLTLLAGSIVGIIPALKVTRATAQDGLKMFSPGGGSGMQLGRTWTFMIVAQVAFAMALLPPILYHAWDATSHVLAKPGTAAEEIVTATLVMDRTTGGPDDAAMRARYAARHGDVERRLTSEPGVTAVTYAVVPPGEELAMVIEAEGVAPPGDPVNYNIVEGSRSGFLARFNRVDPGFFEMYDIRVLAGRAFTQADAGSRAIVVSRTLVDRILGGGDPLGRRIRYVGRSRESRAAVGRDAGTAVEEQPWYEIVGVVSDFPASTGAEWHARIYHPAARDEYHAWTIAARLPGGAPADFATRLRDIAFAVDPDLQVRGVTTRAQIMEREKGVWRVIAAVLGALTVSVVGLVAAGIYAMMSFTVARRRREIGIRAALGADPRRILTGIFSRAFAQLALGAVIGLAISIGFDALGEGDLLQGAGAIVLPAVAVFLTVVGLAAAAVPARRGLRIQPIEALRDS